MKIKEKHIARLSKGQKSGINIGSRSIPHHLYQYEQKKLDLAIKYKFLAITDRQRPNLKNLWEKYCQAKGWDFIILKKFADGQVEVLINEAKHQFKNCKEAKNFIKSHL